MFQKQAHPIHHRLVSEGDSLENIQMLRTSPWLRVTAYVLRTSTSPDPQQQGIGECKIPQ